MTTATDMNIAPSVLFHDNAASVLGTPKQEPALESNHIGLTGLFDRVAANTHGIKPDPAQEIRLTSAMVTGVDAKPVGNAELVERAYAGGGVLQEPGPVRAQSDVAALGSQTAQLGMQVGKEAFKMGGELIGRLFGGGDDPVQKARDAEIDSLRPAPVVVAAPQSLTLG